MYMEKAKSRFDASAEELERILIAKEAEKDGGNGAGKEGKRGLGKAMKGGGGFFKSSKNPAQLQRQEDESRVRMGAANEAFKRAVQDTQAIRQEYFGLHLPKVLRVSAVQRRQFDG